MINFVNRNSTFQYEYLKAILQLIESKDHYTYRHSLRVAKIIASFADYLYMPKELIKEYELAGYLHDIGKIGIPEIILNKTSELTIDERKIMCRHPQLGYEIAETITSLKEILPGILFHHERYDGNGYPAGLRGVEIPCIARSLSIVDTYDALTSDRPYRKKLHFYEALAELMDSRGKQLDPILVNSFCDMMVDDYFSKEQELFQLN